MRLITMAIVAAIVFGICFLVDKGFTRTFRGQSQHKSGRSVRLSKRYGTFGILAFTLGTAAIVVGVTDSRLLLVGGILMVLMGIALIVYYMSFGIFYDDDGFVLTTFGKKSHTYAYGDIKAQQLYTTSGNIVVELHMNDGRTVQLHNIMSGTYDFLDYAFSRWLRDKNQTEEACPFHDPGNSCWFPPVEG